MRGLEFGVRELNAAGGLLGDPVELIVEDDGGKPDASASAAARIVRARACFAISLSNSVATMAAQQVTHEARLPHLAPCQSGRQLATATGNPWFWHTGPSSTLQVRTLVSFCKARGYRSIAVVGDESQLSRLLGQGFAEEIVRAGMRLADAEYHAAVDINRLLRAKPDAVVSAGVRVPELLALLGRWRSRDGMPPLLGSYNFSIADVQAQAGELMDGIAYLDAFDPRKPQAQAFVSSYTRDEGCAPGSVEGYGYDAVLLFADAMRRAGSMDEARVRPAMQATALSGVLGAIGATYEFRDGERAGFDPHGLVVRVHGQPSPQCVVHAGSH